MSDEEFKSLLELQTIMDRHPNSRRAAAAAGLPHSTFYGRLQRLKKELKTRDEVKKSPASMSSDEQKPRHIQAIEYHARQNFEKYGIPIPQGEIASPFHTDEEWLEIFRKVHESLKKLGINRTCN